MYIKQRSPFQRAILRVYHVKILFMAREKRARQIKIYSVHFHGVQPFSLLYFYCKSHAIGTKLDVFGLYFCFDSFKYINFNLKITLPLLLSEQTSVLGKVFEFIFPARVLNKQIAVYKDTSSVDVFLAEIGPSHILFFNLQSIPLA